MKKYLLLLGKTEVFFVALLWLMVLLVAGTIAQKDIGLYQAQEKYFSSFIFYIKGIPFPAGYTIMSIISLSLAIKLFKQKWNYKNSGTIITHIGALMLLFGGFLTAVSSSEGNMVIKEGETANYIEDYHQKEIVFINTSKQNLDTITSFSGAQLKTKNILKHKSIPFNAEIINYYYNSNLTIENGKLALKNKPPEKVNEENIAGVTLKINNNIYNINEQTLISPKIDSYIIKIRNKRTYLPFNVELIKFTKETHPGSNLAKTYSSEIILHDNNINWHSLIKMNNPLRYQGYTFFQSSYIGDNITVLAVVKNLGRLFPYIASIIMSIGLLIHLFQRLPNLFRRRK